MTVAGVGAGAVCAGVTTTGARFSVEVGDGEALETGAGSVALYGCGPVRTGSGVASTRGVAGAAVRGAERRTGVV